MGFLHSKVDDRIFSFTNKNWNAHLPAGSVFDFKFVALGSVAPSNLVAASFNGQPVLTDYGSINNTSEATHLNGRTSVVGKYDYGEVLRGSLLFYEAQRAGKLPSNNRISWRGDSMLMDKGENGEDLTGGYFDAGDYVKFGFPASGFSTLLAYGAIEYEDAYRQSGQLDYVRQAIRWSTDYFIKVSVTYIAHRFAGSGTFSENHRNSLHEKDVFFRGFQLSKLSARDIVINPLK